MDPEAAVALGDYLRSKRTEAGLTGRQLAELTGINDSSLVRIENGYVAEPGPDKLKRIAEALGMSAADVFERAGYAVAGDLPAMEPYLRTKYGDLPQEALEQIERYASKVAKKHGISLEGPAPGQDE
ncbi:helix-turn-helix domain-containing protein [Acidimicrobiales bacterium]|nr:helix-turn-helix domain-containing protein [Acidimicrobiales bacterium]